MSKRNENRPGYKKTKVGWIPNEWEVLHLKFLCAKKSGIKTGPFGSQLHASDYINLKYSNFCQIKVVIPGIEEQRCIAQVLSAADNEINQLEKKLKALEKQKRGLMQKLLTGEIRVIV